MPLLPIPSLCPWHTVTTTREMAGSPGLPAGKLELIKILLLIARATGEMKCNQCLPTGPAQCLACSEHWVIIFTVAGLGVGGGG